MRKRKLVPNSKMVKVINEKKILNLIYTEGPIPRVELAQKTGLSQQTITNIVNRLLKKGIVLETLGSSTGGGRKPIPLIINGKNMYAIGIEIAVQYVRGTLLNFNNQVIKEIMVPVPLYVNPEQPLKYIFQVIDPLLELVPEREALKGIGCSIQGIVYSENGIVIYSPGMSWRDFPLKEKLQERLEYPVYLQNDANLLAIVENLKGSLEKSTQNVTLKFDYGLGGACVINKQILYGSRHVAFEFGHYKAFYGADAYPCHCGSKGCLTTLASVSGLKKNIGYSLDEYYEKIMSGDQKATELFEKTKTAIAYAMANVITLINPDHVLLTGIVIDKTRDLLLPSLEEQVMELIPEACRNVKIVSLPTTHDESRLAAGLVINEYFSVPLSYY